MNRLQHTVFDQHRALRFPFPSSSMDSEPKEPPLKPFINCSDGRGERSAHRRGLQRESCPVQFGSFRAGGHRLRGKSPHQSGWPAQPASCPASTYSARSIVPALLQTSAALASESQSRRSSGTIGTAVAATNAGPVVPVRSKDRQAGRLVQTNVPGERAVGSCHQHFLPIAANNCPDALVRCWPRPIEMCRSLEKALTGLIQ